MITPLEIYAWMLIGMRAAGLVLMAPPFSTRVIPPLIKVTLIASIASVVTFLVDPPAATPVSIVAAVLEMARELGIGFAMGMAIRIIFATLDFAAHLITVEVGLMPGPEFDPSSGVSGNPLGSSLFYFGVILFLSGAHYTALYAFVRSFQLVPLSGLVVETGMLDLLVSRTAGIFQLGILMSAPIIAVNFIVNLAFSVLSRVVPRMNVFILSFSVRIVAGLAVFALSIGLIGNYAANAMAGVPELMLRLLPYRGF